MKKKDKLALWKTRIESCKNSGQKVKVLRYDRNGFVLAYKKLLDKMTFQWSKGSKAVKEISQKQVLFKKF